MKKIFFLLVMLASITASATVTVTPISADYTSQKVTFKVAWTGAAANNRVWVWVDLCPVAGTSPGTFDKATISVASATIGSIATVTGNTRGFYVTTNPSTVTATLSNATGKFNWCAYGSDYPPNVTYNNVTYNSGTYTFKGSPPFKLASADGSQTKEFNKTSILISEIGFVPKNFTDATGCPGIGFCPYTGSDEFMDASHFCHLRTSGAENWETWIKDSRDNELYRIVLMPDSKWWLAQNVKLASYNSSTVGYAVSGCNKDQCGRGYTWAQVYGSYGGTSGSTGRVQGICPPGWLLPLRSDFTLWVSLMGGASAVCANVRGLNAICSPRKDYYGFASIYAVVNGAVWWDYPMDAWYSNDEWRDDGMYCDWNAALACGAMNAMTGYTPAGDLAHVRCFRQ